MIYVLCMSSPSRINNSYSRLHSLLCQLRSTFSPSTQVDWLGILVDIAKFCITKYIKYAHLFLKQNTGFPYGEL